MNFEKFFFCPRCGARLKGNKTCGICNIDAKSGSPFGDSPALGAGGVGWSERINDPIFAKYQKNSRLYMIIFAAMLSILVPAILFATGELSWNDEGRLVLGVIAGMYFISACLSIYKTVRQGKGWEGVVEDKQYIERNRTTEYILIVRLSNGKKKEISYIDDSAMLDYFQIGERIKCHQMKNLRALEKYDKSRDEILFCPSCACMCDARADYCAACGSPLLKGKSATET